MGKSTLPFTTQEKMSDFKVSDKDMVYSACICNYTAINFEDVMMGCKGESTCLCIEEKFCLGVAEPYPPGIIKEDAFFCKISLPCCQYGFKKEFVNPILGGAGQCLCIKG